MIITIDNKKYDVTEFINEHPGGKNVFIDGADMTTEFNNVGHSKSAIKMLEKYLIHDGHDEKVVIDEKVVASDENTYISNSIFEKIFTLNSYLNRNTIFFLICVFAISLFTKYSKNFKNNYGLLVGILLILYSGFNYFGMCFDKRREKNHNIVKSNIQIPDTKLHIIDIKMKSSLAEYVAEYDFKPGQYFNLYIDKEKRPYTPIDYDMSNNSLKFLIKDYGGYGGYNNNKIIVSEKICAFKEGMSIHLDGPFGKSCYYKSSDTLFVFNNLIEKMIEKKNVLMFYCGTGITPFYSVINNVNTDTKYKFKLFGSFKNESENYLKICNNKNVKQKIFYSDSKLSDSNKLSSKKVHKILKKYDPSDTTILVCGSNSYNNMIIDAVKSFDLFDKTFDVYKW